MKIRVAIISALALIMFLAACSINQPVCATSNPLGSKVGYYSQSSILGFPPLASRAAAVAEAARDGGITKISTVNYNITWMIFIVKYETVVTGE
jgi:hypothetical protein